MKSFLGLVNYFRDHLSNIAQAMEPLQQQVTKYHPKHKIKWDDTLDVAFSEVKRKVNECPKLFFVNEYDHIHLHTDASDYGIGAYLFQESSNGDKIPIALEVKH